MIAPALISREVRLTVTPFGRLFAASAVSNLGDGVRLSALPLLAAALTRDPGAVAAMTAVVMLPWLVFGAIGGAIVDRVSRVRLLIVVQIGRLVVVGILAGLVWTDNVTLAMLYVVAFLLGLGEVLADTTMQTLIPALVEHDRLETANGQLYASQTVGNDFVGPPTGSVLFAAVPAAPFALNAATWALSALVLVGLRVENPARAAGPRPSIGRDIVEGARYVAGQPLLRALVGWAMVVNAALISFGSLYVLYALEVLGLTEAAFGFLTAAAGIGGVVGTLLAGRIVRRFGRTLVVQGGSVVAGLATIGAGLITSPILFGLLLVALTASAAVVIIVLTSLRQTIVPGAMLGRATATMRTVTYGAIPLGALAGGWLAREAGLQAPFLVGGFVVVLAGLLIGRWLTPQAIEAARAAARPEAAAQ
jgi:MFS family permease